MSLRRYTRGRYWVNNHAHIVESNGRCDIRYICYLLNQIDLSGYITGSAQPKLNQANLLAIELRLPCLEVQKRVSDFLATFDDKIELNNRINHNLYVTINIFSASSRKYKYRLCVINKKFQSAIVR